MSYPAPPVYGNRTSYHEPSQLQHTQPVPQYYYPPTENNYYPSPYQPAAPVQYPQHSPLPSHSQQSGYFPPPPSPYDPQSLPLYQQPTSVQLPPSLPPRKSDGLTPHYGQAVPTHPSQPPSPMIPMQDSHATNQAVAQTPAFATSQYGHEDPAAALGRLSLNSELPAPKPRPTDMESKNYPFNLDKNAPMIFEHRDIDDNLAYITAPGCDRSTRLYTMELTSTTQRIRPDLVMKRHKDRDIKQPRWIGECAFYPQSLWPKFSWDSWGEWPPDSEGSEVYSWFSDVGTLDKRLMYWHKSHDRSRTGKLFACYCRLAPASMTAEQKLTDIQVNWADPLVCKVEHINNLDSNITILPGYIHTQDQLDEIITVAMALRLKYTYDIVSWLEMEKKWTEKDFENLTDISFVPHNVNGWNKRTFDNEVSSSTAKWKERGKLMASVASLGKNVANLGYQIGVATGSIPGQ